MTYVSPIYTYAMTITLFFPPTFNIPMTNYSLQTTLMLLYVTVTVIVKHNIMLIYVFIIETFTIISVIKF